MCRHTHLVAGGWKCNPAWSKCLQPFLTLPQASQVLQTRSEEEHLTVLPTGCLNFLQQRQLHMIVGSQLKLWRGSPCRRQQLRKFGATRYQSAASAATTGAHPVTCSCGASKAPALSSGKASAEAARHCAAASATDASGCAANSRKMGRLGSRAMHCPAPATCNRIKCRWWAGGAARLHTCNFLPNQATLDRHNRLLQPISDVLKCIFQACALRQAARAGIKRQQCATGRHIHGLKHMLTVPSCCVTGLITSLSQLCSVPL